MHDDGDGAAEGTRTPDPIITNDVLYQLSYCGAGGKIVFSSPACKVRAMPATSFPAMWAWRRGADLGVVDLSGVDLGGVDLRGVINRWAARADG